MMKLKKMLVLWTLSFLVIGPVVAQEETEPVQVQSYSPREVEEFSELKTGKNIRQGAYVRYDPIVGQGLALFETGNYNHGHKEGEWRTYSRDEPWTITSVGNYHADEKDGVWRYYHRFVSFPKAARAINSSTPAGGRPAYINDTTAILQAQGMYAQGQRVGVWIYFNRKKQVIQKIDHFTNRLIYWWPNQDSLGSSIAATADHPLLYIGGKEQLQAEILSVVGWRIAFTFDKSKSAEFIYQIDATGKQTAIVPADVKGDTRFQKLVLPSLAKVPPLWLPQIASGKPVPAEYRVKIIIEVEKDGNRTKGRTLVEPLGN